MPYTPPPPTPESIGALPVDGPLNHQGSAAGFYGATPAAKPPALTAADTTAFTAADMATVDVTFGLEEAGVIGNLRTRLAENEAVTANLRTRLNELESRLRSLGLLT